MTNLARYSGDLRSSATPVIPSSCIRLLIAGVSLLVRGWQIRHKRRATARQRRNSLYLFAHDEWGRTAHIEAHVIDLSPDQVIRGGPASSIRNMCDVYADNCVEQRAAKVRRRAGSG